MQRELTVDPQSLITLTRQLDDQTKEIHFVLLLRDKETNSTVPIFIGQSEHQAIFLILENLTFSRPLTHDLCKNLLVNHQIVITKVVITKLEEDTFYADVYTTEVSGAENITVTDARPSDAVALALRFNAPIFVEESLFLEILDSEYTKNLLDFMEKNRPPAPMPDDYIDTGD